MSSWFTGSEMKPDPQHRTHEATCAFFADPSADCTCSVRKGGPTPQGPIVRAPLAPGQTRMLLGRCTCGVLTFGAKEHDKRPEHHIIATFLVRVEGVVNE